MKLQKLLSYTRQAVERYGMIEEGDKIAVGISGGKDSMTLLLSLYELQKFYPKHFEVVAISVNLGSGNMDFGPIKAFCEQRNITYHIIDTSIYQIVFEERKESNPCSLCAKLRKGALNEMAKELGCNKVAFAHHKDDFIETFYMSLLYEGRISCFEPWTYWEKSDLTLIRPLMYVYEGEIIHFVKENSIPVVHNTCIADGYTNRQKVKDEISDMCKIHPKAKERMFHAIEQKLFEPFIRNME